MRQPQLGYIYRLECTIAEKEVFVGAPHGAGVLRSIAPITGGTFKGPEIQGKVLPGGADWATVIEGTHVGATHEELLQDPLTDKLHPSP